MSSTVSALARWRTVPLVTDSKSTMSFPGHGGSTDADNLITLCWFHHHISVHREGLHIIRTGTSRVGLKRPR